MQQNYMNHKEKLKLARSHMTNAEIKAKVAPFDSQWWNTRKASIAHKVEKQIAEAKKRKEEKLKRKEVTANNEKSQ